MSWQKKEEMAETSSRSFRYSSETEIVVVGSGLAFVFGRSDICGDGGISGRLAICGPCIFGRVIGVVRDSLKTESVMVGSGLAVAVKRRSKMLAPKKNNIDTGEYILET